MRTVMILMTLSSAGAGYVYLQRTPAVSEAFRDKLTSQRLNDGPANTPQNGDTAGTTAKGLVSRVHQNTKSILDDFASLHGGHSDAPTENAFQRLKLATQSTINPFLNRTEESLRDMQSSTEGGLPHSKLRDLQRIAFDLVDEETSPSDRSADPASYPRNHDGQDVASNLERISNVSDRDSANSQTKKLLKLKPTSTVKQTSAPTTTESTKPGGEWKVIGKTTEGRKMHSMHLGASGVRTLVIAGLNGEDRVAVRWLEQLAQGLASQPSLIENNEVVFFRAGNPDGLVHQYKGNARGVPLNRNFPSRRFRQPVGMPQFAVPASEVETRVMLDTLYSFRPRRIIHLSSTTGRSQVIYNRLSKPAATELERSAKLGIFPFDPEQNPGSIEDFADGTLEAAVLSLKVNAGRDWQQTWTRLQPQVMAAVIGRPIDAEQPSLSLPEDPDRTPIPPTNAEPISRNPRRRGYEELPAPPGF